MSDRSEMLKHRRNARRLSDALFFMGGGNTFLEEHGRLCWCAKYGKPGAHSTACENSWIAWKDINGAENYHGAKTEANL